LIEDSENIILKQSWTILCVNKPNALRIGVSSLTIFLSSSVCSHVVIDLQRLSKGKKTPFLCYPFVSLIINGWERSQNDWLSG